jgi:hypothetical protein
MSDFQESAHHQLWLFTPAEVESFRLLANSRVAGSGFIAGSSSLEPKDGAPEEIPQMYTTSKAVQGEGAIKIANMKVEKTAQALQTLEEEEYLLRHFTRQMDMCMSKQEARTLGFVSCEAKHWRVSATSIVYFRRFYLNNSMSTHDPRVIMLGCLILAGKSEESRVERMNELLALNPDCTPQRMLTAELLVIQGLNFNTKIFHPMNFCQALMSDIKRKYSTKSQIRAKDVPAVEPHVFEKWLPSAENVLAALQYTNACLLYTPLDIAFSALYLTESNAFNASLVVINKDIIHVTVKTEQGSAFAAVNGSAVSAEALKKTCFLHYFSGQFGATQYSLSMSCVEGIASLLEAAQNCQDGHGISQVHAAMKRLRSRARWGSSQKGQKKGAIKKENVKVVTSTDMDTVDGEISASTVHSNKRIKLTLKVEE